MTHSFRRDLAIQLCIGVILLLIGAGALVWFLRVPADLCANEPIATDVSPNGTQKAVFFRRDCGATTSYSTHVSIIPASRQLPNKPGNVFVQSGEPTVIIRWIDDHHLSISGGGASTAFVHLANYHGVHITYQTEL
jgi:hypothetical protein